MPENIGNMEVRRTLAQGPHPAYGWYVPTPLMTLDGLSAQDYNQYFKGQIKDAIDSVRFSRLRILGGTAVGLTDKSLFNFSVGQSGVPTADGGTTFKALKDDTNMRQASEMEYGNVFIVEGFECELMTPFQLATADTVNEITDPTAASASATTASATLNALAIATQSWVTFTVGDRTVLEGRVCDWPQSNGFSGIAGGADEGIIINGVGFARALRNIVVLHPGEQFGVTVSFTSNITPTQDMNLVVKLRGTRLRPVG